MWKATFNLPATIITTLTNNVAAWINYLKGFGWV